MEIINQYFGKIVFVKVDLREDHAVYAAALSSSFQDGKKQYTLAFVPMHLAIVDRGYLRDLHWVNVQTRTLTNGYRMPQQRWDIGKGIDNPMFTMIERSEDKTKYISDLYPLEMVLIHDSKKKSKYQYHNHMNLLAALVTFKCVISLIDTQQRLHYTSGGVQGVAPMSSRQAQPQILNREPPGFSKLESLGTKVSTLESLGTAVSQPRNPGEMESTGPEYGVNTTYTPMESTGRYVSIGLPDYTVPQISPQQSSAQRRSAAPRSVATRPPPSGRGQPGGMPTEEGFDDSFELL